MTIVFSDLKGSTAMGEKLDSESLREVMTRYFDSMSAELEKHGGVVEKFIGDAIMAVFGLPKLHEDDALRAVRAAADMQRAQAVLNDELERHWGVRLTVRTGVNTGEVVAGDPTTGQRLVTGDAVNVAARLEQAAGAQEVLLGDLTYRLVRDYVDVEEVEPLELKGKSEPVPAYRLVGVREDAERPRRLDAPMVGRDARARAAARRRCDEAATERRCRLVTVVGEAGVGKSRLIDEFVRSVERRGVGPPRALPPVRRRHHVLAARRGCAPGAGILERDTMEAALQKLAALVGRRRGRSPRRLRDRALADAVPGARSSSGAPASCSRRSRARGPLLVLFDDIHWAEATFLELIEHVVDVAEDAPLLLVCSTRHELVERFPSGRRRPERVRIELERLTEEDAARGRRAPPRRERARRPGPRARSSRPRRAIRSSSSSCCRCSIDEGLIVFEDGCWRAGPEIDRAVVPPTIQALLAARLDYLEQDERTVIEPAAVIGQVFVKDAVSYLVPEHVRDDVGARLGALTEKQLVHPDLSRSLEEEAFRFHHILIRDTAYEGILKRARATFHEQFVEWADGVNREGATEYEEILGYHLEQAHRYLSELGPLDDHGRALGADGSRRLASAGRRAFARGDVPAAVNLLGRAAALLPEREDAAPQLMPEYGEALLQVGRFQDADAAAGRRRSSSDARPARGQAVAWASLVRLLVRLRTGEQESWRDEAAVTITEAMAVFEEAGTTAGLAMGWRLLAWTHGVACRFGLAAEAQEHALEQARLADDVRQQSRAATSIRGVRCLRTDPGRRGDRPLRARCSTRCRATDMPRASCTATSPASWRCRGSFERARELVASARTLLEELGLERRGRARRHRGLAHRDARRRPGCGGERAAPGIRRTRRGRREVHPVDGRRPYGADALRARSLRRRRAHGHPRRGARDRGRHRHAGDVALRHGRRCWPARARSRRRRPSRARRSRSSRRPTASC